MELFFGSTLNNILLLCLIFILNCIGVVIYRKIAINFGILSLLLILVHYIKLQFQGGGIVFSSIFILGVFVFWYIDLLAEEFLPLLGLGGAMAAIFGFVDDIYNVRASYKLVIQIFLGSWVLFWLYSNIDLNSFGFIKYIIFLMLIFFIVWMINAYNFMDGIDGMAISGAFFITSALTLIMIMINGPSEFSFYLHY